MNDTGHSCRTSARTTVARRRRERRQRTSSAALHTVHDARRRAGSGGAAITQPCITLEKVVDDVDGGDGTECQESMVSQIDEERCAALTTALNAPGDARSQAIVALHGSVSSFAFHSMGCRVVQTALGVANRNHVAKYATELRGLVLEAVVSPHCNFVIQSIITTMPSAAINGGFIEQELSGVAVKVARHMFGCRVLCRIFENSLVDSPPSPLADEILVETKVLSRHTFGHFVIECLLEHGLPCQQQSIVSSICDDLSGHALNRNTAAVLAKACACCSVECTELLADRLLCDPNSFVALSAYRNGYSVARAILELPNVFARKQLECLRAQHGMQSLTKYGMLLLNEATAHDLA